MYIATLVEDTINEEKKYLKSEHGLSLFINYNGKNILFDCGPSKTLIENSKKMNIDLSNIDYVIISHGHFDHGGGIIHFLEINKKAKVFIHKSCNKNFYFKTESVKEYIGLNPDLFNKFSDRLVYTENDTVKVDENIFLIQNIQLTKEITKNNESMLINCNDNFYKDDFEHEQVMLISDNNNNYLFSGCSHKGIINITEDVKKEFNLKKIDFFIGGLHLVDDPILRTAINTSDLNEVAQYLKSNIGTTYACHCTGDEAYDYLKTDCKLNQKINYLRTGSEINI